MTASLKVPCTVIRSQRRTAALKITPEGAQVRVPHWVSEQWVTDWLESRQGWIDTHFSRLQQYAISIEQGSLLPFCGERLQLSWKPGSRVQLTTEPGRLRVALSGRSRLPEAEQVRQHLKRWYKQQAQVILQQRLEYWQQQMQLSVKDVRVRDFRRRWGSCSAEGIISLNWRLVMAESELQDYVIIHELCHRRHFNHGRAFWALVQQYHPRWREHRQALNHRAGWLLW